MKHEIEEFVLITIYVDDQSIIGTPQLTAHTISILNVTFEMQDLGPPNLCLGIQFDYLHNGILISQLTYTQKITTKRSICKQHTW